MDDFEKPEKIHKVAECGGQMLMRYSLLIAVAVCLPFPLMVKADALTDLRTTLQSLNAGTAIKGTLDVKSVEIASKPDDKPTPATHIQLQLDASNGLSIHLAPALLQQISAEQQAHANDPEKPTPFGDLLGQVGPLDVENLVSAAPGLLHRLEGAESPVLKQGQLEGKPVQELAVILPLKASKKDSSDIDDYQGGMTLWLDAKGVPLAYVQTYHAKFCKFFLCVTVDETRNAKLQVIGGRLVAVSYTDEHKQSGLGQDGDTKMVYTLTLDTLPGTESK